MVPTKVLNIDIVDSMAELGWTWDSILEYGPY